MPGRIPSLDGWRAMAIVLVLLSHEWATRNPPDVGAWLPLFSQGSLGVRVFFVLSGFLITQLLIREHTKTGTISLRNFYARRVLRIVPVYYLFLLCLLALSVSGLYSDAGTSWLGAMTFTRNVVGHGVSATAHLWSLAVEEQFYLIWPAAFVLFGLATRWRLAAALLLAVIAVSFAARVPACDDPTFLCQRIFGVQSGLKSADALAVGCLVAMLDSSGRLWKLSPSANAALGWFSVLALTASAIPFTFGSRLADSAALSTQAVLIAGAIYSSIFTQPTAWSYRALNCRPVVYLGVISYSLYIWHMLFLKQYMGAAFADLALYDARVWWLPALLVAMCSYHLYEGPIASLRRHFAGPGVLS